MVGKRILTFLLILFFVGAISFKAQAQNPPTISCLMEEDPPLNYTENGVIKGASAEVVQEALKKAGFPYTINVYPWVTVYDKAQKDSNVLIFSIARTAQREKLFKWGGVILPEAYYFFKLKAQGDSVSSLEDIKKFKVGVIKDDFREQYLTSEGFSESTNLVIADSNEALIKMLFKGDIDFLPLTEDKVSSLTKVLGLDPAQLERVDISLAELTKGVYFVFSNATSDEVVEKTRQAFEQIKAEGGLEKLLQKYNIVKKDISGTP